MPPPQRTHGEQGKPPRHRHRQLTGQGCQSSLAGTNRANNVCWPLTKFPFCSYPSPQPRSVPSSGRRPAVDRTWSVHQQIHGEMSPGASLRIRSSCRPGEAKAFKELYEDGIGSEMTASPQRRARRARSCRQAKNPSPLPPKIAGGPGSTRGSYRARLQRDPVCRVPARLRLELTRA
jgi:hypothetical protein